MKSNISSSLNTTPATKSAPHWKWHFNCLKIFSKKFGNGIWGGRHNIWLCWMAGPVAPRNVNEVSYAMMTKIVSFSAWQGHYSVRLEGVASLTENKVSYAMIIKYVSLSAWQAQYLVDQYFESLCTIDIEHDPLPKQYGFLDIGKECSIIHFHNNISVQSCVDQASGFNFMWCIIAISMKMFILVFQCTRATSIPCFYLLHFESHLALSQRAIPSHTKIWLMLQFIPIVADK